MSRLEKEKSGSGIDSKFEAPKEISEMKRLEDEVGSNVLDIRRRLNKIKVVAANRDAVISGKADELLEELNKIAADFEKKASRYR